MINNGPIGKIEQAVAVQAQGLGFQLLGEAGLRHGRWAISFIKRSRPSDLMNRFLFVSAARAGESHQCKIQIWGGADMNRRYKRLRLWESTETEEDILSGSLDEQFRHHFGEAADRVNQILPQELDDTYDLIPAPNEMTAASKG